MADNINEFQLLVQIVAAGSLSKAALNIDSSPPAVSRRLAAMEARLGVRLIERNARRFQLTEAGHTLYERAQRILSEIEDAEAEATSHSARLTGRLRVGAMQQLGHHRLAPVIARFAEQHTGLQIEFVLSDGPMDLADDELDILFQMDAPPVSYVIARRLTSTRLVLCASPDYLQRRGTPVKPDDLMAHDCLCLVRGRHVIDHWKVMQNGVPGEIRVKPRLICSSSEALYKWTLDGYGIGPQFQWDIQADLDSGRLVECLHEFSDWEMDLYALYGQRLHQSPKVKAFLDFLAEDVRQRPISLDLAAT